MGPVSSAGIAAALSGITVFHVLVAVVAVIAIAALCIALYRNRNPIAERTKGFFRRTRETAIHDPQHAA